MYNLCSLLFETESDYEVNLQTLLSNIKDTPKDSIIVAPEVCLTGFDYGNFDAVLAFSNYANEEIKKLSKDKIIILTIIEKRANEAFNFAKIFHNGEIVYERAKAKLFRFGGEHNYFTQGNQENIQIVEINGIKIGVLVCFELRFKELWKMLEGCDVIAVPSWWGVLRTEHFKILTRALSIMNECYVIVGDSANDECTKMSAIINPQGEVFYNGNNSCLEMIYDKKSIKRMRKYMNIGIK